MVIVVVGHGLGLGPETRIARAIHTWTAMKWSDNPVYVSSTSQKKISHRSAQVDDVLSVTGQILDFITREY